LVVAFFDTDRPRVAVLIILIGIGLAVALAPFATGLIGALILWVTFRPLSTWLGDRARPAIAAAWATSYCPCSATRVESGARCTRSRPA